MANDTVYTPVGTTPGSPSPPIVAGVYKERGIRLGYQFTDFFRLDASLRYDHDKRENTTETPNEWLGFINFIAGIYGGLTAKKSILVVQALPAGIALALLAL